jgi:Uma2 family endonuclease
LSDETGILVDVECRMRPKATPLSAAQYLAWEEGSPVKCEYVNGETYAQSGAKRAHNLISGNLFSRAWTAAKTRPGCHVFGSDMKVYVEARNSFYYPDLSVGCDPADRHELYLVRPCFIVEVASASTAMIDRREKRASYLTLDSLREYVIVDQNRMRIDLCRRERAGWCGYMLTEPWDVVECSCLGLRLDLMQIYEGVELPVPGVREPELPEHAVVG